MIAVDTNVVLRRLLNDDATQAEKARRLFETQESVLVTDVVLAETIWTLTGKRYGAGKAELAAVVMGLIRSGGFPGHNQRIFGVVSRRSIRPAVARMVMASSIPRAAVAVSGMT